MTEPTPDRRHPSHPPRLDYAGPEGELTKPVQLTFGIIIALIVVMPLMFAGPIFLGTAGAFLGPVLGIAIVGALAIHLRQADRTRAMAAGIWTGVGIALLVDGICWATLGGM